MKSLRFRPWRLLAGTLLLILVPSVSHALGFRIYDDVDTLRRLGFLFEAHSGYGDVITITVTAPKDFEVNPDEKALGFKPYAWMSLHEMADAAKVGPGYSQSHFRLATTKNAKGHHETTITTFLKPSEKSYLSFMFIEDAPGTWGIVVYVPLSAVVKSARPKP